MHFQPVTNHAEGISVRPELEEIAYSDGKACGMQSLSEAYKIHTLNAIAYFFIKNRTKSFGPAVAGSYQALPIFYLEVCERSNGPKDASKKAFPTRQFCLLKSFQVEDNLNNLLP